jgi:hypothetical protein
MQLLRGTRSQLHANRGSSELRVGTVKVIKFRSMIYGIVPYGCLVFKLVSVLANCKISHFSIFMAYTTCGYSRWHGNASRGS